MENSPLMRLPPELRNNIYELVLVAEYPIEVRTRGSALWKGPAMLQTCHDIRGEAAAIYYSRNTFAVHPLRPAPEREATTSKAVVKWFTALGQSQRDLVEDVRLDDLIYGKRTTAMQRLEACSDLLAREGLRIRARLWVELKTISSEGARNVRWVHD